MSSTLKLYQSAGSPNSRRVRIFLAEKGLELTLVPVDLANREQRSDAYRAINPRQTLVLEDGTAIGEVPAILRYLEETYPTNPLLGATPKEKGLVCARRTEQASGCELPFRSQRPAGGCALRRGRQVFGSRHHRTGDHRLRNKGARHRDSRRAPGAEPLVRQSIGPAQHGCMSRIAFKPREFVDKIEGDSHAPYHHILKSRRTRSPRIRQ